MQWGTTVCLKTSIGLAHAKVLHEKACVLAKQIQVAWQQTLQVIVRIVVQLCLKYNLTRIPMQVVRLPVQQVSSTITTLWMHKEKAPICFLAVQVQRPYQLLWISKQTWQAVKLAITAKTNNLLGDPNKYHQLELWLAEVHVMAHNYRALIRQTEEAAYSRSTLSHILLEREQVQLLV